MATEPNGRERLAMNVADAAAMIGLGRNSTYQLILSGAIPSFKVGARRLVPVSGLRDFVAKRTAEAEVAV